MMLPFLRASTVTHAASPLQTSGRHDITLLEPIEETFPGDFCSLRYIYRASFCMLHSNPIYPFICPVEDEIC